jgi:hypothetical protein
MRNRNQHIKISPEVINSDLFLVKYDAGNSSTIGVIDKCCEITTTTTTTNYTGLTFVYSSMTQILSGGTNGSSLLTGLTIPILLTETATDMGYYSVFDGMVLQQDVMTNFVFTGDSVFPYYTVVLYNTSENELKKYLSFSNYQISWGDGSFEPVSPYTSLPITHTYAGPGEYTISMSGMSPWGYNQVKKVVNIPITGTTISNPNGTAYFTPLGGSWSGTPLMYDYIFSGDSDCDATIDGFNNFLSGDLIITGFTKSILRDLQVYGPKNAPNMFDGKYRVGVQVTGTSGVVGTFYGPSPNGDYTAYTINNIDYYDYSDGTTVFVVSGVSSVDYTCSAITKNEVLLNVVFEPEIQSNVFIERGKNSGLERTIRLGEIDNIGDLEKYGYRFFNIINT